MIALITGRVHPGETPGSHALNGVIKFLLDKYENHFFFFFKK